MPYKTDGKVIPMDKAFTHRGVQYPKNWLRLATEDQRRAVNIIWETK